MVAGHPISFPRGLACDACCKAKKEPFWGSAGAYWFRMISDEAQTSPRVVFLNFLMLGRRLCSDPCARPRGAGVVASHPLFCPLGASIVVRGARQNLRSFGGKIEHQGGPICGFMAYFVPSEAYVGLDPAQDLLGQMWWQDTQFGD